MCNAGGIDRVPRIIAGLALISLVFVGPQVVGRCRAAADRAVQVLPGIHAVRL